MRPTIEVARDLLGKALVHGSTSGTIVETEAYLGLEDPAAHSFRGITARTKVIFGPPGHAYVYLIYGMYECLNIVAEPEGSPGCVLIRAIDPLTGIPLMRRRRPGTKKDRDLANGPGKLTLAMGITRKHNGLDMTGGELTVMEPEARVEFGVGVSARIGLTKAADWPLRFFVQPK
jgi:DNA-3-methyladenine glycosylase